MASVCVWRWCRCVQRGFRLWLEPRGDTSVSPSCHPWEQCPSRNPRCQTQPLPARCPRLLCSLCHRERASILAGQSLAVGNWVFYSDKTRLVCIGSTAGWEMQRLLCTSVAVCLVELGLVAGVHRCSLGAGEVVLTGFGDLAFRLYVGALSGCSACWALPVQSRKMFLCCDLE